jgi:RNA polymerase sigma-70 factor, ECF subfamily
VTSQVLARARAGEEDAFRELTDPYRRELQVHIYRIVGSVQDAEDLLQETLLATWRGLEGFEGRASVRAWLYQIATNRALDALRATRRRPEDLQRMTETPEPTRYGEAIWLEPFPDVLLEGIPDLAATASRTSGYRGHSDTGFSSDGATCVGHRGCASAD